MSKKFKKNIPLCKPFPPIILWDELFPRKRSKKSDLPKGASWRKLRLLKLLKHNLNIS
jgi:hypothetical protein